MSASLPCRAPPPGRLAFALVSALPRPVAGDQLRAVVRRQQLRPFGNVCVAAVQPEARLPLRVQPLFSLPLGSRVRRHKVLAYLTLVPCKAMPFVRQKKKKKKSRGVDTVVVQKSSIGVVSSKEEGGLKVEEVQGMDPWM